MRDETIFYYVTEETVTGEQRILKKRFWQKIRPDSFVVEKDGMTVVAFLIPSLKKGWKREELFRLIRESAEKHPLYSGGVRILIQPRLQFLLAERTDMLLSISLPLTEKMLRERFPVRRGTGRPAEVRNGESGPASAALFMGALFFPEEQIRHFAEMIRPYLPRIHSLTILYRAEETGENALEESVLGETEDGPEVNTLEIAENSRPADRDGDGAHLKEVIQEYADELYYEYGLVCQIMNDAEARSDKYCRPYGQNRTLFLDYGYSGEMPFRMLKNGGMYLDVSSSEEKEALFRRKYRGIFYQSPRKYLDTMVKSGYDK